MKMAKRIFITLLVVAVMVSSFALTSYAAEYTFEDYNNVLEYFEEPTLINYDFTGEDVDFTSDLLLKNPDEVKVEYVTSTEENALFGKYLSLSVNERSGWVSFDDSHMYFAWGADEELTSVGSFNIDMTLAGSVNSAASTEQNLPKVVVAISGEKLDSVDQAGTVIASLDYRNGTFTYLKAVVADDGTVSGGIAYTDFEVEENAWYTLSVTYDVAKGFSTITVTNCEDSANTITVEDGYVPYESVTDIRVGAKGYDDGSARGSEIKLASLTVLGGVYHRVPENMIADVESKVLDMYALAYDEEATLEDQALAADIVKSINDYGFTSENADVQNALSAFANGAAGLFNARMEECINGFDAYPSFNDRRDTVDLCLRYTDYLKNADLAGVDPALVSAIEANSETLVLLSDRLEQTKLATLEFIAAVENEKNVDIDNYSEVSAAALRLQPYTAGIDTTYEGAGDAFDYYERLVNAAERIGSKAESFISAVNIAADETLNFNDRSTAFKSIKKLYYDNTTYPGVSEAIELYKVLEVTMTAAIEKADNFIKYVKKADYADYVTAKQENLDLAKQYSDCNSDYEGVAEARVLYDEVQAFVNLQIANANAYIEAVKALERLAGDDLLAGIEKAKGLREAGNVLGVPGVTDANIKLDEMISSMELDDKYSEYFIKVVASLDSASTAEEIYAILVDAKDAELTANQRYAGVSDASKKLAKAITDYNKKVESANKSFDSANDAAANICGVGVSAKPIETRVIALIKKYFDEE